MFDVVSLFGPGLAGPGLAWPEASDPGALRVTAVLRHLGQVLPEDTMAVMGMSLTIRVQDTQIWGSVGTRSRKFWLYIGFLIGILL